LEIRRFGVGHRRPEGPAGSTGVTGRVIHADARGSIVELAFARGARLAPHSSPNAAWLVVIEGGGWVEIGGESALVAAGEAVLWPAGLDRAARCGGSEMRAIVVELAGCGGARARDSGGPGAPVDTDGTGHANVRPGAVTAPSRSSASGTLDRTGGEDGREARTAGEPL
jgi:quercetin dioxygenase-like cupin family protein